MYEVYLVFILESSHSSAVSSIPKGEVVVHGFRKGDKIIGKTDSNLNREVM